MKQERYITLHGASCASCAYAIEKFGRRLDGILDIHVDGLNARVKVDFSFEQEQRQNRSLRKLIELVRKIGYDASITR